MGVLVMGRKGRGERGGFYITFLIHKRVRNWFTGHSSMTLWLGALGWTGPSEEHEGKGTEKGERRRGTKKGNREKGTEKREPKGTGTEKGKRRNGERGGI